MIDRRKRLAGIVVLFVLLLSVITWIAVRSPEPRTVVSSALPASGAPAPPASETPFVVVASPDAQVPIDNTDAAVRQPRESRQNAVAAPTVTEQPAPPPPPPVASSAPSAAAQAPPAPVDAAVEAAPPVAVASIQPLPPEPTVLASGRFRDTVGPMFRLVQVTCVVDGVAIGAGRAPGGMLFDRRLAPGNHTVAVVAEYQGSGAGVFSYLEGYRFKGQTSRAFSVKVNATTQITVTAFEKGPMVPYEERLALTVDIR